MQVRRRGRGEIRGLGISVGGLGMISCTESLLIIDVVDVDDVDYRMLIMCEKMCRNDMKCL